MRRRRRRPLNVNLTPELELALEQLMQLHLLPTRSDAVRFAVMAAVERDRQPLAAPDFSSWLGLALKTPESPNPRFSSDDDLWSRDP